MNNTGYGKTVKKAINRNYVKLVSNKKDYLNWASKTSYMSPKILDNDLVTEKKVKSTVRCIL